MTERIKSHVKTPKEVLATPIQFLKGVGPERAKLLARLELNTALDVLFFFPRDYQDMSEVRSFDQLEEGATVSVRGTVEEIDVRNGGPGRSVLGVMIRENDLFLRAIWFNQPFMQHRFARGQQVLLSGQVRRPGMRWEMVHPRVQVVDSGGDPPKGEILPLYPLTEGLKQSQIRRIVQGVVLDGVSAVEEVFPDEFLDQYGLWPIRAALPQIHAPTDQMGLEQARRRFIFQELLVLQLALALRRERLTRQCRADAIPVTDRIDARIRQLVPFQLTASQDQAIREIAADMARDFPMNRLLQGDVGSGKTVVAAYAMLLAVAHGYQAALMAPTEVLARQHELTLRSYLAESRVQIVLLTGALTASRRAEVLADVESGNIDLVIGTHAVVQKDVRFARLGLVVIDEQHKFGVRQRARLRQAGNDPHYLVMTATPIPRTVTMTLFGDLDVSTLRDVPPGRQPVYTYLATDDQRDQWWEFFARKLREGRQGYVITPLVEESEQMAAASLQESFEALCNGPLEAFRLDLVHGRMSGEEKEAAMDAFRRGETQVLVATSVVEVGVDVANANLMTIESGERFGLSQLHQLRGRVSRGPVPGHVCVFADARTPEALRRLDALVKTTDGFELAEIDFQQRGPGNLLGTRQHGLPPLRIADLIRDSETLTEARSVAQTLVANDPELSDPKYARLRKMVLARYGHTIDLGDVG
jgi:ATP-dependent DNA helicase RecG